MKSEHAAAAALLKSSLLGCALAKRSGEGSCVRACVEPSAEAKVRCVKKVGLVPQKPSRNPKARRIKFTWPLTISCVRALALASSNGDSNHQIRNPRWSPRISWLHTALPLLYILFDSVVCMSAACGDCRWPTSKTISQRTKYLVYTPQFSHPQTSTRGIIYGDLFSSHVPSGFQYV